MPRYNHLVPNRPLKVSSYIAKDTNGGPPVPDSRTTLRQLRQQGRLNEPTHRPSTAYQGPVNGAHGQPAMNGNTKAPLDTEMKNDRRKMSANGLVNGHLGQEVVNDNAATPDFEQEKSLMVQKYQKPKSYDPKRESGNLPIVHPVTQGMIGKAQMEPRAEPEVSHDFGQYSGQMNMQSDKLNLGQLGFARYRHVPWDYKPERASGLVAGLQTQQLTETGREAETKYSWEDERIFTKCCDIAIGAQCKDQHIAKSGECWNCHEKELQSKAASEAEFWVSHDPRDFVKETTDLPLYAARLSNTDAERQPQTSLPKPSAEIPESTTKEECEREATNFTLNGNGQITSYNESLNGCFAETNTTAPTKHVSSYNRSMSAQSEFLEDYQEDFEVQIDESHKSQEAMQYLLGATEHLEKFCDEYGDQVSEEDKNLIRDSILKVLGGCKSFQALIRERLLESPSELNLQPIPTQVQKPSDTSDPQTSSSEESCNKCEALEARIVHAMDALLGC
ncbi:MAG: hypothetical protein ALECFALPRED_007770 [Alectoria fallacina]|uniref:Uncharacterized protein n=1 Tax=Alectoria fallacina TaxID=1903189 RepID=A0A8H3F039_9LECA|nr:MAG: hypothetical protein ALECFALPRED_007770 [Alectoria fallacina]